MNSFAIEPIGVVRSEPGRSASRVHGEAERHTVIEVDAAHAGTLRGVKKGDEILVVTMREERRDGAAALALHRTRVEALERESLRVAPIGETDGTPVVQIETAGEDRVREPRADPWKFTAAAWPSRYS